MRPFTFAPTVRWPDVRVHRVREVDRRRARGEHLHLALRREDVHLVGEEVGAEAPHVLARILVLVLPVHERLDPREPLVVRLRGAPALVQPVRRDAVLGLLVHLARAHLDLERLPLGPDHGRVQRAVAVELRHRDEVLEPPGHRLPERVDEPERRVAVARPLLARALADDAHRGQVVDLVELAAALGHLVVDRVEVLRARRDVRRNVRLAQLLAEDLRGLVGLRLAVGALVGDHRLDLGVLAWMQRLEREVLELPLERVDAEPVRERRVHLERLARLLRLLLLPLVLDRPHVVEAVGELDEDDADVLRHRDDHLPVVLGLGLLAALEADPRQLRDALDELRDLGAELGAELLEVGVRVLDDVVQERGRDRLLVEMELRADARDAERVMDELLAGAACLARVRALGELERPPEQLLVDVRVVRLDLGDQLLDEVFVMPLRVEDTHGISVLSAVSRSSRAGRSSTGARELRPPMTGFALVASRTHDGSRSPCATRSSPSRPGLG